MSPSTLHPLQRRFGSSQRTCKDLAFMTPLLGSSSSNSFRTYMNEMGERVQKPRVSCSDIRKNRYNEESVSTEKPDLIFESTNPGFVSAAFYLGLNSESARASSNAVSQTTAHPAR
jgi:hypothetical protein